jgi:MFS transporter, SP family, general alpha glucoside:H+ symporter
MGNDEQGQEPTKSHVDISFNFGEEARYATDAEHKMSVWESLKTYPTAAAWSIFFSLGTIMTAFDPQLLGNLYATPAFQRDFGYMYKGSYIISAPWQTALGMGNPIGQGKLIIPSQTKFI